MHVYQSFTQHSHPASLFVTVMIGKNIFLLNNNFPVFLTHFSCFLLRYKWISSSYYEQKKGCGLWGGHARELKETLRYLHLSKVGTWKYGCAVWRASPISSNARNGIVKFYSSEKKAWTSWHLPKKIWICALIRSIRFRRRDWWSAR